MVRPWNRRAGRQGSGMALNGTEISDAASEPVAARFSGSRSALFGTLVAGYLLMLPVLALGFFYFRSREASRMFSKIRLRDAGPRRWPICSTAWPGTTR